jgi:hypothetical protein
LNFKEAIMPVHTAETPMPFPAQHLLGQLIKMSGPYPSEVSFQLQVSEGHAEEDWMLDTFSVVDKIASYSIVEESDGRKSRFAIFERYNMDEDEKIFVYFTHQFLEWAGKAQFVQAFESTQKPLH